MAYPTQSELAEMSAEQKLQLIGDVWDMIESEPDGLALSDDHRAIIEDRLKTLDAHPERVHSWAEMRRRVRPAS